jgi:copper chaperone CopZ
MRYSWIPSLVVAALLAVLAAPVGADGPAAPVRVKLETVFLTVSGVQTEAASAAVLKRVKDVRGVKSATWSVARKEAKVVRVVGQASTPTLVAAVRAAGAQAEQLVLTRKQLVFVTALACGGCVANVTKALLDTKGTKLVFVAEDMRSVRVFFDAKRTTEKKLRAALATAGYPVKPTP